MMKLYGISDVGRVRKENQDSFDFRTLGENIALLTVCDGMGGAQAGRVASSTAVETFVRTVEEALARGNIADPDAWQDALVQACGAANREVFELAEGRWDYRGMGTTLVGAVLSPGLACVVNVGDSRCYLISAGSVRQVTVDHSWVQILVDRGEITREEARTHPKKNLITRAVGVDGEVTCDVSRVEIGPGSRLLLCSDGLSNLLTEEDILRGSLGEEDPERFARSLLDLALERGAPDNVTVVLAQL